MNGLILVISRSLSSKRQGELVFFIIYSNIINIAKIITILTIFIIEKITVIW